ncbi:uncharacterized protein KGF55_002620 [Candida pseudojiufengensis]|uniref:uncharacterized protein n=1 Tax=Candida pseudojiufengensis TaxID=497109 RepID=UPI002224FEB1|nr:uncharacterized protein KGF55_002620 [Candida pseudojiufengensis]KAI5963740.1 hypothetical protein KGF55_002620 [Candida pseudojiufengensis]
MESTNNQQQPNDTDSLPKNEIELKRRTEIMHSIENMDYLLSVAEAQKKSVEEVIYDLKLELINGRGPMFY